MTVTLRPCGPGDAAALALVGQATFLETYAEVVPVTDLLRHCAHQHGEAFYADWLGRADHRLWLAQTATGAPVGYAAMVPSELPVAPEPRDVELRRIYLLRRFQGGGLGAALMATVIDAATQAGFTRLLLSVYGENAGAISFYHRQGFARVGEHRIRVGALDYDDLVLARGLDQVI